MFVRYYQSLNQQKKEEYLQRLWRAADEHNEYFDKHRIFFDRVICSKIDDVNEKLSEACSMLAMFVEDVAAIKIDENRIFEEWEKAMIIMNREVLVIKQLLEDSFREQLGVLRQGS